MGRKKDDMSHGLENEKGRTKEHEMGGDALICSSRFDTCPFLSCSLYVVFFLFFFSTLFPALTTSKSLNKHPDIIKYMTKTE